MPNKDKKNLLPKCKKTKLAASNQTVCDSVFKSIVSGHVKVDDDTIKLLQKCSQNDMENILGKNI